MPDALAAEARGDWSNLKGTEYHLVYVLWALLCERAHSLAFYMGNDLLARASNQATDTSVGEDLPLVPLHDTQADTDVWIQLKATEQQPWTVGELLKDTLLSTFVLNILHSRRNNRHWKIRLITQAPVRKDEVLAFVQDPPKKSELNRKLKGIVTSILEKLEGDDRDKPTRDEIRPLSLTVLQELAGIKPTPLALLRAEVERDLAYSYPDPAAVARQGQTLLGRILVETSSGTSPAPVFDAVWLDRALGRPARPKGLLHENPASALTNWPRALHQQTGICIPMSVARS